MFVTQNGPVHCWRTHSPVRRGLGAVQRNLAPLLGPVRWALASPIVPIHRQPRGLPLTIESDLVRRCVSSSVGPIPVQRKAGPEEAGNDSVRCDSVPIGW